MVSVRELAGVCRAGAQRIMELYPDVTQGQADALAEAGEELFLKIEEVETANWNRTSAQYSSRREFSFMAWTESALDRPTGYGLALTSLAGWTHR